MKAMSCCKPSLWLFWLWLGTIAAAALLGLAIIGGLVAAALVIIGG